MWKKLSRRNHGYVANGLRGHRAMTDYRKLYDLEGYLFGEVSERFAKTGTISAFDFFSIVIWKANRSKSKIAARLLEKGYDDLETAVTDLLEQVRTASTHQERLRILIKDWKLRLPMASSILSVLYPQRFTVYDVRVCGLVPGFDKLTDVTDFERQWSEYQRYVQAVKENVPFRYSLRDKDRWLWGKSFAEQLENDIERRFERPNR
jgi:hypothetical protein